MDGRNSDFWMMSITIFTCVIFVVNLKIALTTQYWTWIFFLSILLTSLIPYFIIVVISGYWEIF